MRPVSIRKVGLNIGLHSPSECAQRFNGRLGDNRPRKRQPFFAASEQVLVNCLFARSAPDRAVTHFGRSKCSTIENDLPCDSTPVQQKMCFRGALKREARTDDRSNPAALEKCKQTPEIRRIHFRA